MCIFVMLEYGGRVNGGFAQLAKDHPIHRKIVKEVTYRRRSAFLHSRSGQNEQTEIEPSYRKLLVR